MLSPIINGKQSSVTSRGKSFQCKTSIVFNNKLFKSQEFYLTSTVFGEGNGTPSWQSGLFDLAGIKFCVLVQDVGIAQG